LFTEVRAELQTTQIRSTNEVTAWIENLARGRQPIRAFMMGFRIIARNDDDVRFVRGELTVCLVRNFDAAKVDAGLQWRRLDRQEFVIDGFAG
jgi:hypothetical protein